MHRKPEPRAAPTHRGRSRSQHRKRIRLRSPTSTTSGTQLRRVFSASSPLRRPRRHVVEYVEGDIVMASGWFECCERPTQPSVVEAARACQRRSCMNLLDHVIESADSAA